jgi:hypothetical protein
MSDDDIIVLYVTWHIIKVLAAARALARNGVDVHRTFTLTPSFGFIFKRSNHYSPSTTTNDERVACFSVCSSKLNRVKTLHFCLRRQLPHRKHHTIGITVRVVLILLLFDFKFCSPSDCFVSFQYRSWWEQKPPTPVA